MNEHQHIFCRARESYTISHMNCCLWSWRQQVQFKIHFCAKDLSQGHTVCGIVAGIDFICWNRQRSKVTKTLLSKSSCLFLGHFINNEPLAILNSTPYMPSPKTAEGNEEDGILTKKPTLDSPCCMLPNLPQRHSTRNLQETHCFHTTLVQFGCRKKKQNNTHHNRSIYPLCAVSEDVKPAVVLCCRTK